MPQPPDEREHACLVQTPTQITFRFFHLKRNTKTTIAPEIVTHIAITIYFKKDFFAYRSALHSIITQQRSTDSKKVKLV